MVMTILILFFVVMPTFVYATREDYYFGWEDLKDTFIDHNCSDPIDLLHLHNDTMVM